MYRHVLELGHGIAHQHGGLAGLGGRLPEVVALAVLHLADHGLGGAVEDEGAVAAVAGFHRVDEVDQLVAGVTVADAVAKAPFTPVLMKPMLPQLQEALSTLV